MKLVTDQNIGSSTTTQGRVAIIGYGSQGRAHALNLRDSGCDVVVGLRAGGRSWSQAQRDGFAPTSVEDAARSARTIAMLAPDTAQPEIYANEIAAQLSKDKALVFAHGFNVLYRRIQCPPDVDVFLVAPKSPGAMVRREYEAGRGVPCLFAVAQDATGRARERALAYAWGLGCTRAGALETTFAEETETDLFGEQAVLCGGATELIAAGFETLVEAGYQPEVAYFECLHELKLIVDLLYEGGFAKMHAFVSDTAKYGDLSRGRRVVDEGTRARMRTLLEEVRSGAFAREWIAEDAAGRGEYRRLLTNDLAHPIEVVGARLRALMPWLAEQPRSAARTGGRTS